MHIFIDESGLFVPGNGGHSVSVVGALIVPDCMCAQLFRRYKRLRPSLIQEHGEVKGRLQDAHAVGRVVDLLLKNHALFEATAIDMGLQTDVDLAYHKERQAQALTANLGPEHHPQLCSDVWNLRARLEQMPLQLYVQSVVTFELIERVLKHTVLYFSQRIPGELAAFNWIVDGKDKTRITDWEDWWSMVIAPALQTRSGTRPLEMFDEGDHRHFDRFTTTPSAYQIERLGFEHDAQATDIGMIMTESFRFSSTTEPGLELVDVITNATRRALNGNLVSEGWRSIPRLMIHRRQHYLQMVHLNRGGLPRTSLPYRNAIRQFQSGGRTMMAPRFRDP